ncbi:glyoxalase/bleomycin resistance/extradiol dioxygenase family protein [Gilvibacter sediminis]|uniref:glyoxalase/bleomycin resistance/extradiol dioxygenase family protein n=1 Tax=Gilvibacter sediminis TaxID=379071 RepID=UPI002350C162|nr:glyoxalase/bleomycin resistance/extradiol dioxygenase family protein [Gilvibacter sediminis]MDC7997238.1 glyoxalase/bleomycin resistance/extradiol dioxygenase family protein [Gilvibacter sediminis]
MPARIPHKQTVAVLPSADLDRDVKWYSEYTGFAKRFANDGYVGLYRDGMEIHLQWHADTAEDPVNGGSVVKFFVESIEGVFKEYLERGTVKASALHLNSPWGTHEFGFFDLNNNAVFFVQDLDP